jgi:hypothetical protein
MIKLQEVFPILADAVGGFVPSEEVREEALSYPFISDMVRFVNDRSYVGTSEAKQLAKLLERLFVEGDHDVHDLAVDALETVSEQENGEIIAQEFGPVTTQVWKEARRAK